MIRKIEEGSCQNRWLKGYISDDFRKQIVYRGG